MKTKTPAGETLEYKVEQGFHIIRIAGRIVWSLRRSGTNWIRALAEYRAREKGK